MATGPRPSGGPDARYDLSLTELLDGGAHRFLVEVGSVRGAEVLAEICAPAASIDDERAADQVEASAAGRMGRTLNTDGLKELLYASVESRRWDDIATRCLACTNCTMVCPTCFCTTALVPRVHVVEREDPTSLIDLWGDRDLAIVVDAVCSDGVPGTVMIAECGVAGVPLTDDAWSRTGRGGRMLSVSRLRSNCPARCIGCPGGWC